MEKNRIFSHSPSLFDAPGTEAEKLEQKCLQFDSFFAKLSYWEGISACYTLIRQSWCEVMALCNHCYQQMEDNRSRQSQ